MRPFKMLSYHFNANNFHKNIPHYQVIPQKKEQEQDRTRTSCVLSDEN